MDTSLSLASQLEQVCDLALSQAKAQWHAEQQQTLTELAQLRSEYQQLQQHHVQLQQQLDEQHEAKASPASLSGASSVDAKREHYELQGLLEELVLLKDAHQAQQQHLTLVEQEWMKAIAELEKVRQRSPAADDSWQFEKQQLQTELEEHKTSKSVIKHHCKQLTVRNDELQALLQHTQQQLEQAELRHQQLSQDYVAQTRQLQDADRTIKAHLAQINKLKQELQMANQNYYEGVLNVHRKVSKNLPN